MATTLDLGLANNGLTSVHPVGAPRSIREVVIATATAVSASQTITSITLASAPGGATATINATALSVGQTASVSAGALTINVSAIGLFHLTVSYSSGESRDLQLFGIEAGAPAAVVQASPPRNGPLSATDQQLILRSVINEGPATAWFTGSALSLVGHSLAAFGA